MKINGRTRVGDSKEAVELAKNYYGERSEYRYSKTENPIFKITNLNLKLVKKLMTSKKIELKRSTPRGSYANAKLS